MDEKKKLSSDAFQWAYDKYIGNDPKEIALYEEERVKADIAQAVYDLRNKAGLSRQQLADLAGTTASVIEEIEASRLRGRLSLDGVKDSRCSSQESGGPFRAGRNTRIR